MSHARKVLVIDDERVVCHSCRRVLEEEGFDVSVATNGREGIEKLSQQNFDAVIVDLRMPGVGGMDVLRILKRTKPDVQAIIITAYSSIATAFHYGQTEPVSGEMLGMLVCFVGIILCLSVAGFFGVPRRSLTLVASLGAGCQH